MHVPLKERGPQQQAPGYELAYECSQRCAAHTHIQTIYQKPVKENVQYRTGSNTYHRQHGIALQAQLVIKCHL